jgi:hypothetical protein
VGEMASLLIYTDVVGKTGRDADYSPHLVPRSRMSMSYISSPPGACMACCGTALALVVGENTR